jgi:Fe-S-cluster containining protein
VAAESKRQDNFFDICGQCKTVCCQDAKPSTTSKRKKIIEEFLKKQGVSIENLFAQTEYAFPKVNNNGWCTFYDEKAHKCQIQPVKPETCVAGPITFYINVKSGKIEWFLKKETICPLAGRLYANEGKLKAHVESAKKEILRLVRELDSTALKALMKIEEPETFKIDEDEIEKEVLEKLK